MGKPVIATDQGVLGWETETYEAGLTVPLDDEKRVLSGIRRLAEDDELRIRLGENARAAFATHTLENMVDAISDTLNLNGRLGK